MLFVQINYDNKLLKMLLVNKLLIKFVISKQSDKQAYILNTSIKMGKKRKKLNK